MTRKTNYTKDAKPMDPRDVAVIDKASQELAVSDEDFAQGDDGLTSADILLPRLTILEGLSPQLKPRNAEFIPNARVGQICDTTFKEVWDEILIVPVEYRNIYIKWAPRGSGEGILEYYGTDSTEYDRIKPNEKMKHIDADGNEIVKHCTIYCLNITAGVRPCTLPMTSTRTKSAQQFNTLYVNDKVLNPKTGVKSTRRRCARVYRVTVGEKTKGENSWGMWNFDRDKLTKEFDPTGSLWREAVKYEEQVKAGLVQADFRREDSGEDRGGGEHDAM